MKAAVDREACIGCELCVSTCPAVFAMDNENKAKVIAETVPDKDKKSCEEARDNCPVNAIQTSD